MFFAGMAPVSYTHLDVYKRQLQDHDSFKINEITSKWHWKSRGIGGMSALRFLMQVDGMGLSLIHI